MKLRPFHVAVAVRDLDEARRFYCGLLGCEEGRSDDQWIDFNLFGHQFVCHHVAGRKSGKDIEEIHNTVDGHDVPIPHYGVVLSMNEWKKFAERLIESDTQFIIEPHIRFRGMPGEQGTLFISDPSGNVLEFKGFRNCDLLFAK